MSLTIRSENDADPYAGLVEQFLSSVFPANLDDSGAVLDALTAAFVATGSVRMGPAPKPEGLVALRQRITYWTSRDLPIAVLSPWGSKKSVNDHTVDVAELQAIRRLEALRDRVRRHYAPGIVVQLGIEDLGGDYLWRDEPGARTASSQYVRDLVALGTVLDGGQGWLRPIPESSHVCYTAFEAKADAFLGPLTDILTVGGTRALDKLHALGWQGDVPAEMVAWYLRSYEKLYPTLGAYERIDKLARYLAQSAARYQTGAKFADKSWAGQYVQVNFPLPVPGLPAGLADARLYYRTLPLSYARTHMPAWRAKGYVVIGNDNSVTPKLASWFEPRDYTPLKVRLSSEHATVCIESDYILGGDA